MIQATLVMKEQWVHLVIVVMAILQPLIVLVLIFGLMLAMAHLLTMLGTRWGDRKASSKSLIFSLAMHVLLGGTIVALIPDYRARIYAELTVVDPTPVSLENPLAPGELDAPQHQPGNVPIWEQTPMTVQPERGRTLTEDVRAPDSEPQKLLESPDFKPELTEDHAELLPESRPVPQQELAADQARLEEASVQMKVDAVQREVRPEVEPAPAMRARANLDNPSLDDPAAPVRPTLTDVQRLTPEPSPALTNDPTSLAVMPTPTGTIPLANPRDEIVRNAGPAPAEAAVNMAGRNTQGNAVPSASVGRTEPRLTRSPLTNSSPTETAGDATPYRPGARPALPDVTSATPQSSISGLNQLSGPSSLMQPQLVRAEEANAPALGSGKASAAYTLRTDEKRQLAILQFGGTQQSEEAVDRALAWLASTQEDDGSWNARKWGSGKVRFDENGVDRENAGINSDVGVTSLAALAFMGKYNTTSTGKYSTNVNRALRWIVSKQQRLDWWKLGADPKINLPTDGYLGGDARRYEAMYCHAMATFALGEAYALSKSTGDAEWLREPLEAAVSFIMNTQTVDGSWRYLSHQPYGDMSVFGWQVMALRSAESAGIAVPSETRLLMVKYLQSAKRGTSGGLASYRQGKLEDGSIDPPSPAMTAEAMFCRQMLGVTTSEAADGEALAYLLANTPSRTSLNYYYWYYGTLAMHQHGGRSWDQWNLAVRDLLISEQRTSGELAGSWDPRDVWGSYGGRIYSTAIATLSLEVYYRYLPLFQAE